MLIAHGHVEARFYAIETVWREAYFARTRENNRMASEALLIHSAILTLVGSDGFKDMIEGLLANE